MNRATSESTMLTKRIIATLLTLWCINLQAQTFLPPAGNFRLGVSKGKENRWLNQKEKVQGVAFQVKKLSDTRGFILEVSVTDTAKADTLYWSFGNCQPDSDINVFSVEGQAFTCYYGESMKLKTLQAVTPTDDIRLSNSHCDTTPKELYESGKRTDLPMLAGRCPLTAGNKLYFCFYEQNAKADYNYYLLPTIFALTNQK